MPPRARIAALLLAALAPAAGMTGCGVFHRSPPLPVVVIPQPPILLPGPAIYPPMPPPSEFAPLEEDATYEWAASLAPDLNLSAPPRRLAESERPRRDQPEPPTSTQPDQPAPQLSVGLTPAQAAVARQQVEQRLAVVRHEMVLLGPRRLDATDSATRAQVGEYFRQANDALAQGDWVRAQNLADKADTLARYLLGR